MEMEILLWCVPNSPFPEADRSNCFAQPSYLIERNKSGCLAKDFIISKVSDSNPRWSRERRGSVKKDIQKGYDTRCFCIVFRPPYDVSAERWPEPIVLVKLSAPSSVEAVVDAVLSQSDHYHNMGRFFSDGQFSLGWEGSECLTSTDDRVTAEYDPSDPNGLANFLRLHLLQFFSVELVAQS